MEQFRKNLFVSDWSFLVYIFIKTYRSYSIYIHGIEVVKAVSLIQERTKNEWDRNESPSNCCFIDCLLEVVVDFYLGQPNRST